jgi:hypothetical protein
MNNSQIKHLIKHFVMAKHEANKTVSSSRASGKAEGLQLALAIVGREQAGFEVLNEVAYLNAYHDNAVPLDRFLALCERAAHHDDDQYNSGEYEYLVYDKNNELVRRDNYNLLSNADHQWIKMILEEGSPEKVNFIEIVNRCGYVIKRLRKEDV